MERDRKVGVISIWDIENYGNRLQNYALDSVINHLGYQACTLKMWPQKKWKRVFQYITNYDVSCLRILLEKIRGNERKYHFIKFEREHIRKDRRFLDSKENASYLNRTYQVFVLGSDQIWNPVFLDESYFFAAFASKEHMTVSYAASMGVSELTKEDEDKLKKGLQGVKCVSVREQRAAEIIERIAGKRPQVVLDPTMLIEQKEWECLEIMPGFVKGDYVLLYYLGDLPKECMQAIRQWCEEKGCEMIVIGRPEYPYYHSVGPAQFLYLVHHAKLVCTDSFHGCVFSILYHTPFHVFERENSVQKMNSRIETLLDTFQLTERKKETGDFSFSLDCDFSKSDTILRAAKEKSMAFLKGALEGKE